MNRKGELEIAINKRMLERAIFLIIIIALAVFSFMQRNAATNIDLEEVAILEQRVSEQNAQLEQLAQQLSIAEEKAEEAEAAAAEPEPEEEEAEEMPELSGTIQYDWEVDGVVMTPIQYNAEKIDELALEIEELEERLEDEEGETASRLEDEINDLEDEIRDLKVGEPKFKLNNVTITIDNGEEDPAIVDYILCWPQIDCLKVTTEGTINVASGESVEHVVDITIPRTITITKARQVLRLTLKQENKEVFKEDYTIAAP